MQEIRAFRVPKGAVAVWWFGQNSFLFKSPAGTLASVDLYLTDSCNGLVPGMNLSRKVPILLPPEEVEADVFTCTHNHQDHTDPETIRHLRHKDTMHFVGPHPSCNVFSLEGVEAGRIVPAWPTHTLEFADLRLTGAFALPTDASDLNHMGFVYQFAHGPKIYVTGDTAPSDLLESVASCEPDVVITVMNGGFNNLSHWQAADLMAKLKPKAAIPCHYDMFPDNAADPRQFRAALRVKAPGVAYQELRHGEPWIFAR